MKKYLALSVLAFGTWGLNNTAAVAGGHTPNGENGALAAGSYHRPYFQYLKKNGEVGKVEFSSFSDSSDEGFRHEGLIFCRDLHNGRPGVRMMAWPLMPGSHGGVGSYIVEDSRNSRILVGRMAGNYGEKCFEYHGWVSRDEFETQVENEAKMIQERMALLLANFRGFLESVSAPNADAVPEIVTEAYRLNQRFGADIGASDSGQYGRPYFYLTKVLAPSFQRARQVLQSIPEEDWSLTQTLDRLEAVYVAHLGGWGLDHQRALILLASEWFGFTQFKELKEQADFYHRNSPEFKEVHARMVEFARQAQFKEFVQRYDRYGSVPDYLRESWLILKRWIEDYDLAP